MRCSTEARFCASSGLATSSWSSLPPFRGTAPLLVRSLFFFFVCSFHALPPPRNSHHLFNLSLRHACSFCPLCFSCKLLFIFPFDRPLPSASPPSLLASRGRVIAPRPSRCSLSLLPPLSLCLTAALVPTPMRGKNRGTARRDVNADVPCACVYVCVCDLAPTNPVRPPARDAAAC